MAEARPLSKVACIHTAADAPRMPGLTRRSALALAGGLLVAACAKGGQPTPAAPAPFVSRGMRADHVVVRKSSRSLTLLNGAKPFTSYQIALGFAPEGHKMRERDGRTPEGVYWIDRRNPRSAFHLSLGISYPNVVDVVRSRALGFRPGSDIFIHGEPNSGEYARGTDWTAGCIAVSNAEIEEIWAVVPNGTQISILA